jgi:hypothetical protein
MDPEFKELKYDDQYYANELANIRAQLAKTPSYYTGMGGIEGSLAPNLPRLPESNYVSADLRINVRNKLNECAVLLTDVDRAEDKNKKNQILNIIYDKIDALKTMKMDPDYVQELKRVEREYRSKQRQISAMPDEAMPAATGGSRKRRSIKPKKSNKSRKTKSRKTKSRKTKSRRH